jgi:hypothetical protein
MGELLSALKVDDLKQSKNHLQGEAKILDSCFVTSFNWVSDSSGKPTVLIPGERVASR